MKKYLLVLVMLSVSVVLPKDAFALTISPTKLEIAGDPGQTIIGEIELFNEQSETKTFYTSYENFEPRGETGSPYFVGGSEGLATWVSTQESVTIASGERTVVPYSITIPSEAVPGGYFAAIFFGNQPLTSEDGARSEVSIGGKLGLLVLLRVNGEVNEDGGLLEFLAFDNKFVFSSLPVSFSYRFNNAGGDRVIPRGEVVITNTLGGKTRVLSANANEGSVLPQSTRRFEMLWSGEGTKNSDSFWSNVRYQTSNFHFGLYTCTVSLVWGETAQSATAVARIFLFPWQLLTVLLVGLILFVVTLKMYNRMIIARSRRIS